MLNNKVISILFIFLLQSICFSYTQLIEDSLETENILLSNATFSDTAGDTLVFLKDGNLTLVHKDSLIKASGIVPDSVAKSYISDTTKSLPPWVNDNNDPTGFVNRNTVLTFDNSTRKFKIDGIHEVYFSGQSELFNSDSVIIPDVSALYIIYYDGSKLIAQTTSFPPFTTPYIATVYWNTSIDMGLLGEERHGMSMSSSTHEYLHNTYGVQYSFGLGIAVLDYTFTSDTGVIYDEDIDLSISPATTTSILYKNGTTTFDWDTGSTALYKGAPGSLVYNDGNDLANVTSNQYVATWVFASNNIDDQILTILGQRTDVTITAARNNNTYQSLLLSDLPFKEIKLLYRIIWRNDGTPYEETLDLRTSSISGNNYSPIQHSTLTGLSYDLSAHSGFATGTDGQADSVADHSHSIDSVINLQDSLNNKSDIDHNHNHATLTNLNSTSYTHLLQSTKDGLTGGGDFSAHYHSSDRDRLNHTGTQAISTVDGLQDALDDKATTAHALTHLFGGSDQLYNQDLNTNDDAQFNMLYVVDSLYLGFAGSVGTIVQSYTFYPEWTFNKSFHQAGNFSSIMSDNAGTVGAGLRLMLADTINDKYKDWTIHHSGPNFRNSLEVLYIDTNGTYNTTNMRKYFEIDTTGVVSVFNNFNLYNDNVKMFFGASLDASIYFNGVHMVFNSQEVGGGDFYFDGGGFVMENGRIMIKEDDVLFSITGGNATNSGANLTMFGGSHPTLANIFRIRQDGTTRMWMATDGKTGFGTTSPLSLLDVNGEFRVSAAARDMVFDDGAILLSNNTTNFLISGGSSTGDGLNFAFFGGAHPTLPNYFRIRQNTTTVLEMENDHHLQLPLDNQKLLMGAAGDVSVQHVDGSGMVFNSQEVGSGDFLFNGGDLIAANQLFNEGNPTSIQDQLDLKAPLTHGVTTNYYGVAASSTTLGDGNISKSGNTTSINSVGTNLTLQLMSTDADCVLGLYDNTTTGTVGIGAQGDDLRIYSGGATQIVVQSDGKINITDNDITNVGTIEFDNTANYIIQIEDDANSGVYYDPADHRWNWHYNGVEAAFIDLDDGGGASFGTWNMTNNDITNVGTIEFDDVANYIIQVEDDPASGIYYDPAERDWEYRYNGVMTANTNLQSGDITTIGEYFIDPSQAGGGLHAIDSDQYLLLSAGGYANIDSGAWIYLNGNNTFGGGDVEVASGGNGEITLAAPYLNLKWGLVGDGEYMTIYPKGDEVRFVPDAANGSEDVRIGESDGGLLIENGGSFYFDLQNSVDNAVYMTRNGGAQEGLVITAVDRDLYIDYVEDNIENSPGTMRFRNKRYGAESWNFLQSEPDGDLQLYADKDLRIEAVENIHIGVDGEPVYIGSEADILCTLYTYIAVPGVYAARSAVRIQESAGMVSVHVYGNLIGTLGTTGTYIKLQEGYTFPEPVEGGWDRIFPIMVQSNGATTSGMAYMSSNDIVEVYLSSGSNISAGTGGVYTLNFSYLTSQ